MACDGLACSDFSLSVKRLAVVNSQHLQVNILKKGDMVQRIDQKSAKSALKLVARWPHRIILALFDDS